MLEAIQNRISRRTFFNDNLTQEKIQKIQSELTLLNNHSQLAMELIEDGGKAFSKLRKSYGMFTNVKSLILMKGYCDDNNLKEKIGYYGEELVLWLTTLGLGTCWVGGTFDKKEFRMNDNEKLICVIAVGKVPEMALKEKMIRSTISKKRKPIEQRLCSDTDDLPTWLADGMKAVTLAPTAKNSQKPLFEYKNGHLTAKVPNDYEFDLVDLGIAKKHFEIATNGTFKLGNGGTFQLNEASINKKINI